MKAKAELFEMLSLAEQVQKAMPVARRIIEYGVWAPEGNERTFAEQVAEFLDDPNLVETDPDKRDLMDDRLSAARAIGIALGLMLRPEAFDLKGGGR